MIKCLIVCLLLIIPFTIPNDSQSQVVYSCDRHNDDPFGSPYHYDIVKIHNGMADYLYYSKKIGYIDYYKLSHKGRSGILAIVSLVEQMSDMLYINNILGADTIVAAIKESERSGGIIVYGLGNVLIIYVRFLEEMFLSGQITHQYAQSIIDSAKCK